MCSASACWWWGGGIEFRDFSAEARSACILFASIDSASRWIVHGGIGEKLEGERLVVVVVDVSI